MINDVNERRWMNKRRMRLARYIVLPLLFLVLAVVLPIVSSEKGNRSANTSGEAEVDDAAAIEALYGIRFKRVNLLAGGGAVEFRFSVVDSDKANAYMHNPDNLPTLIAEDSGVRVEPPGMARGSLRFRFKSGFGYPRLYGNPDGAIQSGRPITVEFGDLRLEHIIVE